MGTFGLGGLHKKGTWLYPVATFADLPPSAVDGAMITVLDSNVVYQYDASIPDWVPVTGGAGSVGTGGAAGRFFLGSILDYSAPGSAAAGNIQFTQVYLYAGTIIDRMSVYVESGGSVTRSVRLGIYEQADPALVTGIPVTRVAQTAALTTATDNGTYKVMNLTTPVTYTVPMTGYYWLAEVSDSNSLKLLTTPHVYLPNSMPTRREVGAGTTLPATAGVLTNGSSAIIFVSAYQQGS